MEEIIFHYNGNIISISCTSDQKMEDICSIFSKKINKNLESLSFFYGENKLNLEKTFEEIKKENKINVKVCENDNNICTKCEEILKNKLTIIKGQIEEVIKDINNKKDIIDINSHLKEIIDNIDKDIKKKNNQFNQIKVQEIPKNNNNIKSYKENKSEIQPSKNEIICIYDKQDKEILLLHNFRYLKSLNPEDKKFYEESKNSINGENIDIYINDKKIDFNHIYTSEEKGEIKVKFIFNKILTTTHDMFTNCINLKSIDLSSFNSSKVTNTGFMFYNCPSLEFINFSSFNTENVDNMNCMFYGCSKLKSINLSSFITSKVYNINSMFAGCSSLRSIDLSTFDTKKVRNMQFLFARCLSLISIDLSSFDTSNINKNENLGGMFIECNLLKIENIKINNSGKKILDDLIKCRKKS